MSSYRPGSRRTYGPPPPPPPPKRRTGLIIGIIVAIIVIIIIIVVILLLVGGSKPAPKTGCTVTGCASGTICNTASGLCVACLANTDCSSGKKCNASHTCVSCLANTDCASGEKCNSAGACVVCTADSDCATGQTCNASGVCTAGACTTNIDCTNAAFPVCHASQCVECTVNADCTGNPVYSVPGENVCQTSTNKCLQCITNADCGVGNTCNSDGTCCILTPPTMAAATGTLSGDSTIQGSYSFVGTLTGIQQTMQLLANTTVLSTSATEPATQVHTFDETAAGVIFFPSISYNVQAKLTYPCGTTAYGAPVSGTMPDNGTIPAIMGFSSASVGGPITLTFFNRYFTDLVGVVMSPVSGTHPNLCPVQVNNITPTLSGYNANITFNWPSGVVRSIGQQWFARAFIMQFPSGTVSTSAPSNLTPEAVTTL